MEINMRPEKAVSIRDRVVGLKRIAKKDLEPHPANWRRHPDNQKDALSKLLADVGFAGVALVREVSSAGKKKRYQMIDGHLRDEATPDNFKIPCAVLDVTEEEALRLLAQYDPIGELANSDRDALKEILGSIRGDGELDGLLADLAARNNLMELLPEFDPRDEWGGMPEFGNEDLESKRKILVNFRTEEAAHEFAKLLGQEITEKTRSMWYPPEEVVKTAEVRY